MPLINGAAPAPPPAPKPTVDPATAALYAAANAPSPLDQLKASFDPSLQAGAAQNVAHFADLQTFSGATSFHTGTGDPTPAGQTVGPPPLPNQKSRDSQPAAVTAQNTTISQDTANDLKLLAIARDQFTANILSGVDQPAYHFRLFMTESTDLIQPGQKYDAILNTLDKVIIAETGVTGFNIKDVQIEALVGPNFRSQTANATKITITIVEPMGTSLLDRIFEAAVNLGITDITGNYRKIFYYLELSFKGYDSSTGALNNNVLAGRFANNGVWLYQLQISNIETNIDVGGGTYVLTCIPYQDTALESDIVRLPETIVVEGATIGDMLDGVVDALNKTVFERYAYFQLYDYQKFVLHPVKVAAGTPSDPRYSDPRQFAVKPSDPDHNNIRTYSYLDSVDGKIHGHFARGTAITDVIETVFANSELAQQLCKDVKKVNDVDDPAKKFRESYVMRVEPDVAVLGFDPITRLYQKRITLHVWPYATQLPVLSEIQVANAQDPAVQQAMVDRMKQRGFLMKRYDYIFTGLNTEVMGMDIRFNLVWDAVLPRFEGFYTQDTYNANRAVGAKFASDAVDVSPFAALQQLQDQRHKLMERLTRVREAAKANPSQPSPDDSGLTAEEEQQRLSDNLGETENAIDFLNSKIKDERTTQVQAQKDAAQARQRIGTVFAEADILPDTRSPRVQNISVVQQNADPKFQVTGSMPSQYHRDKSIVGAVLDQLYEPMTQQLINISMEIRGDPYWIGPSNIDRRQFLNGQGVSLQDDPQRRFPDYYDGDNCFLLAFKYPYRYGDDSGTPILRDQDTFNGIYAVRRVQHSFSGGQFKQTIDAIVSPLVDVLKAFGVDVIQRSANQVTDSSTSTTVPTQQPGQ